MNANKKNENILMGVKVNLREANTENQIKSSSKRKRERKI